MTWFKVDDKLWGHQKWRAIPPPARGLWVTAGSWCADQLTDGFIPRHILGLLDGNTRQANQLVAAGLWEETEGGWQFHQWANDGNGTVRNPSREEVEHERSAARERQKRARDKARESRRDTPVTPTVSHAVTPPLVTVPPTRPDLSTSRGVTTPTTAPNPPPPRRCNIHAQWPDEAQIPACGPCADARRTHDAWQANHQGIRGLSNNRDPRATAYNDQQRAEREAAERHMAELATTSIEIETSGAGLASARESLHHPTARNTNDTRESEDR